MRLQFANEDKVFHSKLKEFSLSLPFPNRWILWKLSSKLRIWQILLPLNVPPLATIFCCIHQTQDTRQLIWFKNDFIFFFLYECCFESNEALSILAMMPLRRRPHYIRWNDCHMLHISNLNFVEILSYVRLLDGLVYKTYNHYQWFVIFLLPMKK